MPDTKQKLEEVEKKINLIKLRIEKRRDRIAYYDKLIKMGLAFDDMRRLEFFAAIKEIEVKKLLKELDWLYMQKSFYEL